MPGHKVVIPQKPKKAVHQPKKKPDQPDLSQVITVEAVKAVAQQQHNTMLKNLKAMPEGFTLMGRSKADLLKMVEKLNPANHGKKGK
jgi:hypothetical protein